MSRKRAWIAPLLLTPLALPATTITIQGQSTASPGTAVKFTLTNGTQQLTPDAWLQGYNPDRYTGDDYVSSSALAIAPQSDGVNLGLILAGEGQFREAEKEIQTAVRLSPDNASALTALGMVQTRLGKPAEGIENFRKVVVLTPNDPEAHLNLGIALADHLDLEGALSEFSEAVRLKPDSAAAHYNKGRALFDLRRNEEAELELAAAVRLDPSGASALYLMAVAEKQLDHAAHSADLLRRALSINPRDTDAHYMLGQVLLKLGKESEALAEWQKVVELDPEHAEALYNLARHLHGTDPEKAKLYQARFVQLQQERRITERADTLGNFALAAASARDWNQAIAQLEEAVEVCGNCQSKGDLHKDLGLIYCRSGNLERGERELRVAQSLKPNDPDVKKSLEMIAELRRSGAQSQTIH